MFGIRLAFRSTTYMLIFIIFMEILIKLEGCIDLLPFFLVKRVGVCKNFVSRLKFLVEKSVFLILLLESFRKKHLLRKIFSETVDHLILLFDFFSEWPTLLKPLLLLLLYSRSLGVDILDLLRLGEV